MFAEDIVSCFLCDTVGDSEVSYSPLVIIINISLIPHVCTLLACKLRWMTNRISYLLYCECSMLMYFSEVRLCNIKTG